MVSREARVLMGAMPLVLAVFVGLELVTTSLGVEHWVNPLVAFLCFVGAGVVGPQAYLARTDDSRSGLTRLRIAVLLTVVFGLVFVTGADGSARLGIWAVLGTTVLGWFSYEFLIAYRTARADPSPGGGA